MARILIKVEKDDVKTSKLGNNIMVQCDNNIDLIFTPETLQELIDDYNNIISDKKPSDVSGSFNRFEEFFRNQREDVYYGGVKMDKKEVLDLVKEFFKTVKENDEGMWKDGMDGSAVWSRYKD